MRAHTHWQIAWLVPVVAEAGVEAVTLEKVGVFWQTFDDKPDKELEIHVFTCSEWRGHICDTDEMRPRWFEFQDIPYHNMWRDDTYGVQINQIQAHRWV
jgi:hypothetical protein